MTTVRQIFTALKGSWYFKREISNEGIAVGKANFVEIDPNTLHYREEGILTTERNYSTHFHREYLYRCEKLDSVNDEITVYFAQPTRLFIKLSFEKSRKEASGSHLCRLDTYDAIYHFLDSHTFHITYRVKGPRKDYVSETLFKKSIVNNCRISDY